MEIVGHTESECPSSTEESRRGYRGSEGQRRPMWCSRAQSPFSKSIRLTGFKPGSSSPTPKRT